MQHRARHRCTLLLGIALSVVATPDRATTQIVPNARTTLPKDIVAGRVTLAWDANTEPTLGGYQLYYGPTSGNYTADVDVGNQTSYTVANLQEGNTYYFAVKAYDTTKTSWSAYSAEVSKTITSTTTAIVSIPPTNAPPRKPEPRTETSARRPLVLPSQPSSAAPVTGRDQGVRGLVITAALLMGAILALVAVLLRYRKRQPRANSDAQPLLPDAFLLDLSGVTGRTRHELGAFTVVGRVPTTEANHIVIDRPTIGRVHALVEYKHQGFWLVDRNSKNGTYVNGNRITGPVCLTHGDRLQFHDFAFEFALAAMSLADATIVAGRHLSLLKNSGTSAGSAAAKQMRLDGRSQNQATNPETTALDDGTPWRGGNEGKSDRDGAKHHQTTAVRPRIDESSPNVIEKAIESAPALEGEDSSNKNIPHAANVILTERTGSNTLTPVLVTRAAETSEFISPLQGTKQEVVIDVGELTRLGIVTPETPNCRIAEELRYIKHRLLGIKADYGNEHHATDKSNLILISSSGIDEGKTFLSLNLAISIAMDADRRVILVDADVIRADVTKMLGTGGRLGLTDFLTRPDLELTDVLIQTNIDRLQILPAGNKVPSLTEYLSSKRMERLLRELGQRYQDWIVIFDSPPLLAASETSVLTGLVGQVVIVVEEEKTTHQELLAALRHIAPSPQIKLVLNKSIERSETLYYERYQRG